MRGSDTQLEQTASAAGLSGAAPSGARLSSVTETLRSETSTSRAGAQPLQLEAAGGGDFYLKAGGSYVGLENDGSDKWLKKGLPAVKFAIVEV